ncbi:hypothetical protein SPI_08899 [Niveomyces insectorum RCEF 264]|uniref:Protein kinase-like domain protein n=1 Tax=Niveomyces insectorum RCEF 264 TaxID=1081102 RepID=A0A162MCS0_9HYPO|nr:hypothetical protein SPI_08899 [Niveomyces insectorum RCEF 264]
MDMEKFFGQLYGSTYHPFLSEDLMEGPPSCTKADFKHPRLRRYPFDLETVNWDEAIVLGVGLDGHVWRVRFQDDETYYALKVFWINRPPQSPHEYSARIECQNNALLQMVETAVQNANMMGEPIVLGDRPENRLVARHNLFSFCDEYRGRARQKRLQRFAKQAEQALEPAKDTEPVLEAELVKMVEKVKQAGLAGEVKQVKQVEHRERTEYTEQPNRVDEPERKPGSFRLPPPPVSKPVKIDSVPPLVRCYGWLPFGSKDIRKMPRQIQPYAYERKGVTVRRLRDSEEHVAIVYEYVPGDKNTIEDVDQAIFFFHCVGFHMNAFTHERNWREGKLIDYSDLMSPFSVGWSRHRWHARSFLKS